jgi:hypothetical protein
MRDSPRGRSGERIGREPDMAEGITHGVDLQDPGQAGKPAGQRPPYGVVVDVAELLGVHARSGDSYLESTFASRPRRQGPAAKREHLHYTP